MLRFTCTAVLALSAFFITACSEGGGDPSIVSEAVESPAKAPDYGSRTSVSPDAVEDTTKDYQ